MGYVQILGIGTCRPHSWYVQGYVQITGPAAYGSTSTTSQSPEAVRRPTQNVLLVPAGPMELPKCRESRLSHNFFIKSNRENLDEMQRLFGWCSLEVIDGKIKSGAVEDGDIDSPDKIETNPHFKTTVTCMTNSVR